MSASAGKAVFLSYASQDAEAAKRICEALRAAGVEVWFDQDALTGGDAWDGKIRGQIGSCALFMPVISASTQARSEGYFRLEWKLAAQRTHMISERTAFLLPVLIDATRDPEADVPTEFRAVQWTRLRGGETPAAFVARVQKLLATPSAPVMAPLGAPLSVAVAPTERSGLPLWVSLALGAAVVALASVVVMRPTGKDAVPYTKPVAESKPGTAPAAAVADKSIAVLPFENRSADRETNAIFTDGVHDDILTHLARVRALRVVSRTSVEQYRQTKKAAPQIARELGVTFILEGSVQRDGSQVRVTGQLIRAATDDHMWAKTFDRDLTAAGVFAIQSDLARAIASELQAALSPQEKKLLARRPTEDLAAYDLFLKARDSVNRDALALAGLQKQEALLQAAVELDPKFAAAWGELAATHVRYMVAKADTTPARLAKATTAIDQARRLEPDSPDVIRSVSVYYDSGLNDRRRAAEQAEKLLRLQPNDADAHRLLGNIQFNEGRYADALASRQAAVRLDPGNAAAADELAFVLRRGRRFVAATAAQRRVVGLRPDSVNDQIALAHLAFLASGATLETEQLASRLEALAPTSIQAAGLRITLALWRGDLAEAIRIDRLHPEPASAGEINPSIFSRTPTMALAYSAQGNVEATRARFGDSRTDLRARLEVHPENTMILRQLAVLEAVLGEKEAALGFAQKAIDLAPKGMVLEQARFVLAMVCAVTGEKDRAIAELTRALHAPGLANIHELKVMPAFHRVRGDARFEALVSDPKNNAPLF